MFGKKPRSLFSTPKLSGDSLPLLLSGNAICTGELYASGDGVIDATFSGPALSDSLIGVGPNGQVKGPMEGRDISLAGNYLGDATARQHVAMKKGCVVKGRCRSQSLEVEEGSHYEGLLIIGIDDKDLTSSGKLRT